MSGPVIVPACAVLCLSASAAPPANVRSSQRTGVWGGKKRGARYSGKNATHGLKRNHGPRSGARAGGKNATRLGARRPVASWHRPEFRHILFEIWVAWAARENFGKFGAVAGLSGGGKSLRMFLLFSSPTDLPSLPQPKGLQDSRDRRWPSPAAVCTPHACSDAAEPISRSTRLHSRPPASGSLPTSPVFGICAFPSREHAGIGAHFHVKLIEIWARIRHINETNLGAFPSKLWPVPSHGVV